MKESFATRVEVYSMSTLPNVMILIGSTKVNGQDVVLVKAVYFTLGKSQPMKKVSILLLYFLLLRTVLFIVLNMKKSFIIDNEAPNQFFYTLNNTVLFIKETLTMFLFPSILTPLMSSGLFSISFFSISQ